jgi:hypothetical protein
LEAASHGLAALAPRLEPPEVSRAFDGLLAIIEKSRESYALIAASNGLASLAPRLEPPEVSRAFDGLLAIIEKSRESYALIAASNGLASLAPRLEPPEVSRAFDELLAKIEKSSESNDLEDASNALGALLPFLNPKQKTLVEIKLVNSLSRSDRLAEASNYLLPRIVLRHGSRTIAKLLAHPYCCRDARDILLKRFEELALYNGQPVFREPKPAPGNSETVVATGNTGAEIATDRTVAETGVKESPVPERQFRRIHDAAAWIERNWPDFDLDATLPVVWHVESD